MTIDPAWEAEHARRPWGKYAHQAVVEFIGRHYGLLESYSGPRAMRAIDLGCGAGASAIFLAREGFDVMAIDGSRSAIDRLCDRMTCETNPVIARIDAHCTDIVSVVNPQGIFDCALDVCCLSCLSLDQAEHVILKVHKWLKPGGRMLSVMAADDCDEGVHAPFAVRQIDALGIESLFSGFRDLFVGKHTRLTRRGCISEWVVEVQK